jgi:hypothetical protein
MLCSKRCSWISGRIAPPRRTERTGPFSPPCRRLRDNKIASPTPGMLNGIVRNEPMTLPPHERSVIPIVL